MAADTTENSSAGVVEKLKSYVRTQKGTILAAEIVLSLIILICYASSWYGGYTAVAICEMCFAIVFFCVFMMNLDQQFTAISWVWSDFIRAFTGTLVYLITSLICVIRGAGDGALIAGGVFGLLAGLLFAYDTYTIYLQIKSVRSQTGGSGSPA
ncbi:proteolipid protein 2 isoform X1 [Poecilia formosa]|uniref:proteolipid protein 2 isoform X1 n=1 Tax=Poecilia formosa TaxID=48698 RepID=UPI0004441443|nr:PREDICTED: proteolipid protein 2 isoform X1 [Poecilia formosa]